MSFTFVGKDAYSPDTKDRIRLLGCHTCCRLNHEWTNNKGVHNRIVALQSGVGAVYGVVEQTHPGLAPLSSALVILTRIKKGEFGYAILEEFENPVNCKFPQNLFKELSSPEALAAVYSSRAIDNSRAWRKAVMDGYELKMKLRTIRVGQVLDFKEPLFFKFANGPVEVSQFKVLEWGRKRRFEALPSSGVGSFRCRLSKYALDQRQYSVA